MYVSRSRRPLDPSTGTGRPGSSSRRCGGEGTEQGALFHEHGREGNPAWTAGQARLMEAVDRANGRFGKQAVSFGSMGPPSALKAARAQAGAPSWESRRERMTPRYTTRWDELPVVLVG